MEIFAYPANFDPDPDGGFVIRFPDVPMAISQGESLDDAIEQAADCIEEAIASLISDGEEIPSPSRLAAGQHLISVPVETALKAALYMRMRRQGISAANLANRLGCNLSEAQRLIDPAHRSPLESLENTLRALGVSVSVSVASDAA